MLLRDDTIVLVMLCGTWHEKVIYMEIPNSVIVYLLLPTAG